MTVAAKSHSQSKDEDLAPSRPTLQKVIFLVGLIFIAIGLLGYIVPVFLGMHLTGAHNIIHLATGIIALACTRRNNPRAAYIYSISMGAIYLLLSIGGVLLGEPQTDTEQYMLTLTSFLMLGTSDHIFHAIVGVFLLVSAYIYRVITPMKLRVDKER